MKGTYLFLAFNLISVHSCQSCLTFTNYNVTFTATNFQYMLHWDNDNLPPNVSFNVQYKQYGQTEWLVLHGCQNISKGYCNLTNAITGDEEDFMENQYFGRVQALSPNCISDWVISKRLNPRDDTYLDLPTLNYIPHVNSITIFIPSLSVPVRGRDKKHMTVENLYRDVHFEYHLNFFNPEKQDIWQKSQRDRTFQVYGLSPNTEYNGSIYVSISNERKSDIQFFAVKTLPDYSLVTLSASLVAFLITGLGVGIFFLSYRYLRHRVNIPNSLVIKKSTPQSLMAMPKDNIISSCTVGFCPSTFIQNYEQKHQDISRKVWEDISGNSQLQIYASQLHGAITEGQDSAADTQESSHCRQNITNSLVSSVPYAEVLQRTYIQITPPDPCIKLSSDSEGEFQINTHQPLVDYDGDLSNAVIDNPFKFDLFSSLLCEESSVDLSSIAPMGLISSVTVRDNDDIIGQSEHTEEQSPVLLTELYFHGFTSNPVEEPMVHVTSSYILQNPVESSTTETLDTRNVYKKQCIL
ncbi:hypothetical protein GDO81_025134 [Engystomops pustulosus]|uniref:Fibronectin type-III domain-containing protein n=2 Tax=Engystomops pustulosus TaxID=76066 RepID=A0AAV6ZLX7_ENGPU|nr:hypothetical protein GDO81_025134 [Engystomops pustulosus]